MKWPFEQLSKADLAWFEKLKQAIWNYEEARRYNPPTVYMKRTIKMREWQRAVRLIKKLALPCTLVGAENSFGIRIHNHPDTAGEKPPDIITITCGHLPGGRTFDSQESFMRKYFKPLVYRGGNKRLITFFSLPPLKENPYEYCY